MSRREFLVRACGFGLSAGAAGALLAACGTQKGAGGGASPTPLDTTKPKKLVLYNWSDYLSPKLPKEFERQTGIHVVESYFDDNEALLAKMSAGGTGYDVVVPTGWMVSIMAKSKLLRPLEMSLIPNFTHTASMFQKPAYDPGTPKRYSVPYLWGSTGIAVRTDKVKEQITSYQSLWDPKYKGQIIMLDGPKDCLCLALLLLGYSPNSTDMKELQEAKQKLIEQKPLVLKYDPAPLRALETGNPLTEEWDGDVVRAKHDIGVDKLEYVYPVEGFMVWTDTFAVPKGAPSPYWSHKLIDFMLDPKNAAESSNFTGYQTPSEDALPMIKDPILKAIRPTAEQMKRAYPYEDLGTFNRVYTQLWADIKSA